MAKLSSETHHEEIRDAVDSLYNLKENYFDLYSMEDAATKTETLSSKKAETIRIILDHELKSKISKAHFYLQLGKAHNVLELYDKAAEEYLAKSTKLDPSLVESWNQLGQCLFKKGDFEGAHNCFTSALSKSRNKESLCFLSMTLRQMGSSGDEKTDYLAKSVELAKEAIKLDLSCGMSWYVIGNAFILQFFHGGQNEKHIKLALNAYAKALNDNKMKFDPDLFYNRGLAYLYQESYEDALQDFEYSVRLEPDWLQPKDILDSLTGYLRTIVKIIFLKGGLKPKRLDTILNTFPPNSENATLENVRQGSCKNLASKVVGFVSAVNGVPVTIVVTDYADASVTRVHLELKENECVDYSLVRVNFPSKIGLNGKAWSSDRQAVTEVTTYAR